MDRYDLKAALTLIFLLLGSNAFADTALQYVDKGNELYKLGELDAAIFNYSKAIEDDPKMSKAYNNRGAAYAQEGSTQRAIADFTMAIANNMNDEQAYNNRGHVYSKLGNYAQAILDFNQAIRINSIYIKAYDNRSLAYFMIKDYDKAWKDVFKIEELGGKVDADFYQELKKIQTKDQ